MDQLPPPSEAELVRLLDEERDAAVSAVREADEQERPGPRARRRFEGALPLEDFLREIEDPRG